MYRARLWRRGTAGRLDDQRHTQSRAIGEEPVLVLAMLAQRLAVVAQQNDERPVVESGLAQVIKHPSELAVRVGNLAVVEVAGVARVKRFRWIIGTVGIVEVKPHEEWPGVRATSFLVVKPSQQMGNCFVAAPPDVSRVPRFKLPRIEPVVVGPEPALQSPGRVEHEGAYKGGGRVAVTLKSLSDQAHVRTQRASREVVHAVPH